MLLKSIKGVTDAVICDIINKRGSINGIFSAGVDELYSYGMKSEAALNVANGRYNETFVDSEIAKAQKNGVQIITYESDAYPPLLREIYSAPVYFYAKGNAACLKEPAIAIVGSRKATHAGIDFAHKIASDLASVGVTVVSGFAYGIDIAAHTGAMEKGATAVVLGSGMANIYPRQHIKYAKPIVERGCIITEYAFSEPPNAYNFPKRNRIISGLSLGALIVEASERSGSLITARMALEQNRQVFAVPYFPTSIHSATNKLLKQGAKVVESYLDIIEEFSDIFRAVVSEDGPSEQKAEFTGLTALIMDEVLLNPCSIDELCGKFNADVSGVLAATTELEMGGYIMRNEEGDFIPSSRD